MSIEQFIIDNREQFDHELPSPKVWEGIERSLDEAGFSKKEKTMPRLRPIGGGRRLWFLAAAASFLLVGMVGFYLGKRSSEAPGEQVSLRNISPEAAEAEAYYVRTISAKTEELETHEYHNDQVDGDLAAIDRAMAELRHELANVPPGRQEAVVNALIENYQIKLKILDKVLNRVQLPEAASAVADSLNLKKGLQHDTDSI